MSDEADGRPEAETEEDQTRPGDIGQDAAAQHRIQRALGYDWGGYDLASPWDTGHEIVAVGRSPLPPAAAALAAETDAVLDRSVVPSLEELMTPERLAEHGRRRVRFEAAAVIEQAAREVEAGRPMDGWWVERTVDERLRQRMRAVINATGSIVDAALGGSPWGESALTAARRAGGFVDADFDVSTARWGARGQGVERRLCALTGAEAALAVSSQSGAVLLALAALADAGRVVVCRGDLVELPDGRRVTDLLRLAGVDALPVGAVNRTALGDVLAPLDEVLDGGPPVAAIYCVEHALRRRALNAPSVAELARQGVPLVVDHALGTLHGEAVGSSTVTEAVDAGAEVVCFAGDGPLGGPQSGLVVGRKAVLDRMRDHPLYGMLRLDKTLLAALEATLDDRLRGLPLPIDRMLDYPLDELRVAVEHWQAVLSSRIACRVVDVPEGDGRSPDDRPSVALAIDAPDPQAIAVALARGEPAVMGRFRDGALLLDARTVVPLDRGGRLLDALETAIEAVMRF